MQHPAAIIFFDGVCNLCNASVQYVLKRDTKNVFQFASLQSDYSQQFFKEHNYTHISDSLVLYSDNKFYTESTAALRIAKQLRFPANLWFICIVIPAPLRDIFYRYIAKHRYSWFGKKDTCMVPSKEIANKFLDA